MGESWELIRCSESWPMELYRCRECGAQTWSHDTPGRCSCQPSADELETRLLRLQRTRARNLVERLRTMVVVLAWRLSERQCTGRFVTASRAVRLTERANRIEAKYLKEGT